jgi:pilus assembly protein FimV
MQLRTIALVFSTVGILYSGFTSALGLGEITLKSQFNQPLNAEIRLLKVRDLSKEEIFTALASREDFKRLGVDRLFFLSGFDFEVVLKNPSTPFIRVTSPKPITEPYLNFLIEVQWPSGRLLREYTLLLDLPVFNETSASTPVSAPSKVAVASPVVVSPAPKVSNLEPVISPPRATQPAPKLAPAPAPKTTASVKPTPGVVQESGVSVDDYKVKSGDTLWEIAEATRADSSISVHQRMIAILQANPNAFIKGNINRLKNGRVLRIPSNEEVANVSYQQAVDAVRVQNQTWTAQSKSAQKAVLTSAAPSTQVNQEGTQVEGRLTLGSADSGQSSVKGSGASGTGESLQNELAIANDELSRSTRQNEELSVRVSELEAQIETMESLVSVTNDQLKALELSAKTSNAVDSSAIDTDVADAGLGSAVVETTVAPVVDGDAVDQGAATQESTDIAAEAVVIEEPALVETPAPFVAPESVTAIKVPTVIETIINFLKTNMLVVGGAVLALLAAILVMLRLKSKPEDEVDDFGLDGEDEDLFDLDEDSLDEPSYEEDNTFSVDEDLDDSVHAQTEDVVAEADIYISLGQEDKAIELLQKEIQQNPDNADARLGLLKIFAKAQNSTGFDEQYAQLLPLGNVYANDQAMVLRKEIDNAEPFDTDQYSLKDDGLGFLDELEDSDLDINLDAVPESVDDGSIAFSESDTDLDLDDLSLDLGDLSNDPLDGEEDNVLSEPTDTDFSLDLDELKEDLSSGLDDELKVSTNLEIDANIEDIEFSLDLDDIADIESEDNSLDLDRELEDASLEGISFDLDDKAEDDSIEDIEFDLDLDLDDDLNDITIDEGLGNDFSVELDGDMNDLDFDIPADDAKSLSFSLDDDLDLDADLETVEPDSDDSLDLDSPPPTNIDMASLDQEIDAMTADMDDLSIDDDIAFTPTEPAETLDLDAGEELELSNDEKESALSDLDINDANDDTVLSEDDELDFLEESDEVSTKLDLAKAYMDMGDREGAEDILNEVLEEGNDHQKSDAKALMEKL